MCCTLRYLANEGALHSFLRPRLNPLLCFPLGFSLEMLLPLTVISLSLMSPPLMPRVQLDREIYFIRANSILFSRVESRRNDLPDYCIITFIRLMLIVEVLSRQCAIKGALCSLAVHLHPPPPPSSPERESPTKLRSFSINFNVHSDHRVEYFFAAYYSIHLFRIQSFGIQLFEIPSANPQILVSSLDRRKVESRLTFVS